MIDVGAVVTFRYPPAEVLYAGQVIRMKELPDSDYKVEVRGRSGRTLVLDSFHKSGGMIWPSYTHADLYVEGGWEALCEKKLVDTYYFDCTEARAEDAADRQKRKPSMVKEDKRYVNEPLHIRKES